MTLRLLKKWVRPQHYFGASWPDYFAFLGQHRDSDSVTRSNFMVALERLGGESDTVRVVRESHWLVGWVEWIAIHESDTATTEAAEKMLSKLEGYPVLSDDHWGELEYGEACDYWASMSVRDRAHYIAESGCGASIFAARRDYLPQDDNGRLYERLTSV